jgi:F0F1-type ATP synthase membrane subunit b/b'
MPTDISRIIGEIKVLEKTQGEAQLELSKFEGQLEQEMKRLKDDFDLDSVTLAEKESNKLEMKISKIDDLIRSKYRDLKDNYDVT